MGEVKFEVGQRWRTKTSGQFLLEYVGEMSVRSDNVEVGSFSRGYLSGLGELVAPAPKPMQRWQNDGDGDVQIAEGDVGTLIAEDWATGEVMHRGDAVAVARWLAGGGYCCVIDPCMACVEAERAGAACVKHSGGTIKPEHVARSDSFTKPSNARACSASDTENLGEFDGVRFRHRDDDRILYMATHDGDGAYTLAWTGENGYLERSDGYSHACIGQSFAEGLWIRVDRGTKARDISPMASLAYAVAEVFSVPTREQSRRYVDMAVAALPDKRHAGAVKATLVAMSPDRGDMGLSPREIMAIVDACRAWEHARASLPFANRRLTEAEMSDLTETASLAVFGRVSLARACIIGSYVAQVYERARSL
jgi:hypothetical protein